MVDAAGRGVDHPEGSGTMPLTTDACVAIAIVLGAAHMAQPNRETGPAQIEVVVTDCAGRAAGATPDTGGKPTHARTTVRVRGGDDNNGG
jgi:hypothetical protein